MSHPAVFLDRDGVLIEDIGLLTDPDQARLLPGAAAALARLQQAGFLAMVVSNQPVVARGLATEEQVRRTHARVDGLLVAAGASPIDGWYYCPHHPKATLPEWRGECECRKPKPGMLLRAAAEHEIDLRQSFMVGDRITDIIAGQRAGCVTIMVETGMHTAPPIQTSEPIDLGVKADYVCGNLAEAARFILGKRGKRDSRPKK